MSNVVDIVVVDGKRLVWWWGGSGLAWSQHQPERDRTFEGCLTYLFLLDRFSKSTIFDFADFENFSHD